MSAAFKKPTSKRALCATMTESPMKWLSVPSNDSIRGAGMIMASVMPVRIVMNGGMVHPGFTRVWKVPMHSPPRYLAAPISVMRSCSAEPPVVSKSMTQNVTSHSGVPISSKDFCTLRVFPNKCSVSSLMGVKSLREVKPQTVQILVTCPTVAVCPPVIAAPCAET